MTAKLDLPDVNDLYAAYLAGESTVDMGKRLGCHSSTLRNLIKRHGLPLRTFTEMQLALNASRSVERRKEIVRAANSAARGRRATLAERCQRALFRERVPLPMTEAETIVHAALQRLGVAIQRERACGPYNIDFAVDHAIAVECFGGGWHAKGRAAARHQKRCRDLIDAGWHVVIVWVDKRRHGRSIMALKHVITELQRASRDPAAPRQYRMIWSDGEVVACGADGDDFPLKPPGEVRRDPTTGRYYRS